MAKDRDKPRKPEPERGPADFDLHKLDVEWERQPGMYLKAGERLADARLKHEEAKIDLSIVLAETDLAIRQDPEKFGLDKATDAAVKAAIPNAKAVKKAQRIVLDAKHDVDMLDALCRALEHRKRALEKAVDLHLAGYFGEPSKGSGSRKEKLQETARKRVRGVRDEDDSDDD